MLQQRLGKGGGPIVVRRKRPASPTIDSLINHQVPLQLSYRYRTLCRIGKNRRPFREAVMMGSQDNRAGNPQDESGKTSIGIRQIKDAQTQTGLLQDFGWRFV